MKIEYLILAIAWAAIVTLLFIWLPRNKIREAWVIFLFKQFITWILGLVVVELHLIEYPIRIFTYAHKTSFSFEFFIYPSICVLFNLYYPISKSTFRQCFHYFSYVTIITFVELILEKYTLLIDYIHWSWYYSWVSLSITFYISHRFYKWFFKR